MKFQTFNLTIENGIAFVTLNRPEKANSINEHAWQEMKLLFEYLEEVPEARVILLSGEGKHFCSGIDLSMFGSVLSFGDESCAGRARENLRKFILDLQDSINMIEKCSKPVLAAIHGACVGGGLDLVAACDMRYASEDAYFCIKEIDLGMTADLGSLQRLPRIMPDGLVRELAYTGRNMSAREAKRAGLVNEVWKSREELMEGVMRIAEEIASKSPLSIRGTKNMLLYARDHSVEDGLRYIATWNAGMFLSEDLQAAFRAKMEKAEAKFRD